MPPQPGSTGAILIDLRLSVGASQAQLAKRSGVSERTIRDLEAGRVASPRTGTVLALAAGLDLPRDVTEQFIVTARNMERARSFRQIALSRDLFDVRSAIKEDLIRSFLDKRVVSASRTIHIGANRQIAYERYVTVVEALTDGVDSHVVASQAGSSQDDMGMVEFDELVGCAVRTRALDKNHRALAVELDLGKPLRTGETKVLGWRELNGWASHPPKTAEGVARIDTAYTNRFLRPTSVLSFHLVFEGERPSRIWQVRGMDEFVDRHDLELDEFGTATATWENAGPSWFRAEWRWD
ncbi:helix-turn-helix domain-containing protein [Demetria terragena]|uniref:helix-turn-helix domain-containing protein n=1 Tax=Demetria terragena TaxID=63959 RepID=UPI0014615594|nr:helix-turn-helix transcriptional regulator [Demetria terragena]